MSKISKLKYEFVVYYNNGEKLYQKYNTKDESHFGHIKQELLQKFVLTNSKNSYSVDLKTGEFDLNGVKFRFNDFNGLENYRLIYFRRIRQIINSPVEIHDLKYCFGIQATSGGKNRQFLVWIDEETDKITVGGKK